MYSIFCFYCNFSISSILSPVISATSSFELFLLNSFLAIAILCLLMAILKKRYILGHLITVSAYVLYSYLTLSTARNYFTHLDGENIKFTGMYIFATALIVISLFLIIIFSAGIKSINRNKTA